MDCSGKIAVVTGGGTGYGYGMAQALKARGARVWITGRRREVLEKAAAELQVDYLPADVGSPADWDRLFAAVGPRLDILVNNAGGGIKIAPLTEQDDAEILQSLHSNLLGAILGCKRAAQRMKTARSGLIVNVSSICAHYGWPNFSVYTAAKAGLDKFSRTLYTELRPYNIRVTVVTPSWGSTEFSRAAGLPEAAPAAAAKMMSPAEMGRLIVRLCEFPEHLVFPEVMVQPLEQEIVPF